MTSSERERPGEQNEGLEDFAICRFCGGNSGIAELFCAAALELADAGDFQFAPDQLWPSLRPPRAKQNSVRRVPRRPRPRRIFRAAHDAALGGDDARGTGKIPTWAWGGVGAVGRISRHSREGITRIKQRRGSTSGDIY